MQFDSMHTNPTIKSMSLHREETKDAQTHFTDREYFTFRHQQDKPRGSPSSRYASTVFDDL